MSVTVTPYFTPTSITGCRLWLDGADPAGTRVLPANASSLSTWVDKSGNGFNATANGTAATYNTNAVVFAGAQNYSTSLSSTMLTQSAFAVISYTGSAYMDIISVNSTNSPAKILTTLDKCYMQIDGSFIPKIFMLTAGSILLNCVVQEIKDKGQIAILTFTGTTQDEYKFSCNKVSKT